MKVRLRIPHAVVFVVTTAAVAASVAGACGDDLECVRCLPDTRVDAGAGDPQPPPCPVCLPKDGVCPAGCLPEGYV
jgi:hypothetical protein